MNTPSPLLPKGALPQKPKSTIYFKILMVLGIHVVVIGGLLLQGCKDTAKESAKDSTPLADQSTPASNPSPAPVPAPAPVDTSAATPTAQANTTVSAVPAPITQPPATMPAPPINTPTVATTPAIPTTTPALGGGREYVVAQGDTLGAIARRNGVSLRALEEANAGINPRKLHVGQKIQLPAGGSGVGATASASVAGASAPDASAPTTDAVVYTVKPGDMLFRIAKAHGTRVKTIMELNDMKTTSIRVGQKLKLPSKMATSELPAPVSPATQTASAPQLAPSTGSAAPTASAN